MLCVCTIVSCYGSFFHNDYPPNSILQNPQWTTICTTYGQQGALLNGDRRGVPNEYDDEKGVKIKLKVVYISIWNKRKIRSLWHLVKIKVKKNSLLFFFGVMHLLPH